MEGPEIDDIDIDVGEKKSGKDTSQENKPVTPKQTIEEMKNEFDEM